MLIRGKSWWWNYFKEALFAMFTSIKGEIVLSNGYSETEIRLDSDISANQIYVGVLAEGIPVCATNVDMVGAIIKDEHTFILYADIKSNSATVYWLIEYTGINPPNDL